MNANRKKISGQLKAATRGATVVTDTGDHWVLDDCDPSNNLFDEAVIVEGVVIWLDRIRVEWIGKSES